MSRSILIYEYECNGCGVTMTAEDDDDARNKGWTPDADETSLDDSEDYCSVCSLARHAKE